LPASFEVVASGSGTSLGPAGAQRPHDSTALILLVSGLTGALVYFARRAFIAVGLAVLFPPCALVAEEHETQTPRIQTSS
jgi:hypothetical protein